MINFHYKYIKKPLYVWEYKLFELRFDEDVSSALSAPWVRGYSDGVLKLGLKEKLYYFVLRNSGDIAYNWLILLPLRKREFQKKMLDKNFFKNSNDLVKTLGNRELVECFILRRKLISDSELFWIYRLIAFKRLGEAKRVRELEGLFRKEELKNLIHLYESGIKTCEKEKGDIAKGYLEVDREVLEELKELFRKENR